MENIDQNIYTDKNIAIIDFKFTIEKKEVWVKIFKKIDLNDDIYYDIINNSDVDVVMLHIPPDPDSQTLIPHRWVKNIKGELLKNYSLANPYRTPAEIEIKLHIPDEDKRDENVA